MMRLIALLLLMIGILWLVVSLYRYVMRLLRIGKKAKEDATTSTSDIRDISEELVACATCGVFTPLREAVKYGGYYYCSKACLPD